MLFDDLALNIIHLKSSNSTSKTNVELPGINPLPTPSLPIETKTPHISNKI